MIGGRYPEQSTEQTNLDWLLRTVEKLRIDVEELINGGMSRLIDEYFNKVMVDAIYDEETETITLKKELIVGDGNHVYNMGTNTMSIE